MQKAFSCIYSHPGSHSFERFIAGAGSDRFHLSPFNGSPQILAGKTERFNFESELDWPSEMIESEKAIFKSEYEAQVERAVEWCSSKKGKVVLSRFADFRLKIDIPQSLRELRKSYSNAFVYALFHPQWGSWIGATPELLLQKEKDQFQTVSLAGTKAISESWTEKEQVEQQVVTEYILDRLNAQAHLHGPRDEVFGEIKHLKTDISWSSNQPLKDVLKALHPTPAVCGFPVNEAKEFIRSTELYERKLYTGYLGIESEKQTKIYVNLRCMQVFENSVRFYAGGGINSMSNPEDEWHETERKINSTREVVIKA